MRVYCDAMQEFQLLQNVSCMAVTTIFLGLILSRLNILKRGIQSKKEWALPIYEWNSSTVDLDTKCVVLVLICKDPNDYPKSKYRVL